MTVKELIDKLATLPPDMEVIEYLEYTEDSDDCEYRQIDMEGWKPRIMSFTIDHCSEDGLEWDEVFTDDNGTDCLVI